MGPDFDVIVAGGGPGGASAAYTLGEAGQRVLVLEKETFPRYKACGGATTTRLLAQFPFDFEPVIESRVKAITYACRDEAVMFDLPECPMRMTMRADLDALLLSHAKAEVRQGDAVSLVEEKSDRVIVTTRSGSQFQARYLVGADGPNSVVAHCLGLRRNKTLLGAIEVEAPVPKDVFERFKDAPAYIFGEIDMGYLWIFPKAEHLSVGIGAVHPKAGELQATLRRVMAQYGVPLEGLPMHGHPVPVYTRREQISTARALLVGDAAGLVDPISGEGICYAVESGRMAAEAILADQIPQYEGKIYRKIGAGHRVNWIVTQVIYRHAETSFGLLVRNPYGRPAFANLFSGRGSAQQCMLRALLSVPRYLAVEGLRKLARIS